MATDTLPNESIAANWQAAWEPYSAAKSEADEYDRTVFNPAWEKIEAARAAAGPLPIEDLKKLEAETVPDWDAINEKIEELNGEAYSEREWVVLLTPAPDRAALEWKMNRLFGDCGDYCDSIRIDGINAFLADVRRLLNH